MRAILIIVLVFATGIFVVTASKTRNYSHFIKHRPRPREIRGFKPEHMSTAIGFGKRQSTVDVSKTNKNERTLPILSNYMPRSLPVEWLYRQMRTNPEFAVKLTELMMNTNGNFMMTDHPTPKRTMSLL